MTTHVILEVNTQDGKADAFKALLREILPDTRRYEGCIQIEILTNLENPNDFAVLEQWHSAEAYQNYLNWRAETGLFDKLEALVTSKPRIRQFSLNDI